MVYRVLADVAMTLHFLFLVYVLLGGFLAWRWPRAWFPHAAVVAYGLIIAAFDFDCPLTPVEHYLRLRAGQAGLEPTGFIDTYIEGVVYPVEYILPARVLAALIIAVSWTGALLAERRRRLRPTGSTTSGPTVTH
ncbi:DUF2784 domain-containing protein [Glycomyces buryatensis]|uniref:DUF2784 domain-containing protein n=1 Tax=Glycomyces buryatensis TaxID=2570927 RepID=A0A4S8QBV1_9ACTN|nr:DUF2784 domain-containing protein [Glycomyces buryatensis]THV41987.1 DUF2784 domain-containing protein [Glycomyces buryatensis]